MGAIAEQPFGVLLFLGYLDERLGILGAVRSPITFLTAVTIVPFMPNGWDSAAGFPTMTGNVAFLKKDVVLFTVSVYSLKQDMTLVALSSDKVAMGLAAEF